jgi:hypothetical protein
MNSVNQKLKNWTEEIFQKIKYIKTIDELILLEQSDEILKKYRMRFDPLHEMHISISPMEINTLIQNGLLDKDFSFNKNISSVLKDPLTKLLFAISWKNGDLNKIRHIVQGIYNSKQTVIKDGNAVVFQQFGKFLANKSVNPIIDQHVIRAYAAFNAETDEEFVNAQNINALNKKHLHLISNYVEWLESDFFQTNLKNNSRFRHQVDKILFGIGKAIKIKKTKK